MKPDPRPATRYRAPPRDALRVAPLDDLTAIFHRASGITHLVVSPVPELLEALAGTWRTADEVAAMFELVDGDAGVVAAKLDELVASGLVEAR